MIESDYYKDYRGPPLVVCIIDNQDHTKLIKEKYGQNHNWNGNLYTYRELFGDDCEHKQYKMTFINCWIYGTILDKDQYFHPKKFDINKHKNIT